MIQRVKIYEVFEVNKFNPSPQNVFAYNNTILVRIVNNE